MKLFKKILLGLSPIALFSISTPIVASCSNQPSLNDVVDKLLSIKQIKRVEVITDCPSFKYKFILKYEQPVSWTDSSKGTFLQRVEFGFNSYSSINIMLIDGYDIIDKKFNQECTNELVTMFDSNYINIEYRYFGQSKPSFYNTQKTSTWDDLNFENAIKDFHCINETLKTILKGKWIIAGGSKGGQNANLYSMYFPQDADAFVSYVAPKCYSFEQSDKDRLIDFVVNSIGNDSDLGKTKAAQMRNEYLKWQHYMLSDDLADTIAPQYHELSIKADPYPQYIYDNKYALYYETIIDWSVNKWQYNENPTEVDTNIVEINKMEDNNPEKKTKAIKYFWDEVNIGNGGFNNDIYSYYVQGWKQMGLYNMNPGVLDNKFKQLGWTNINWKISSSDFNDFAYKILFNEDFMTNVGHDAEIGPKLVEWSKTTKSNVIMVYGSTDPWYSYALDKTDNPNIHIFVDKINPHTAYIKTLDDAQKNEATNLLHQWIK